MPKLRCKAPRCIKSTLSNDQCDRFYICGPYRNSALYILGNDSMKTTRLTLGAAILSIVPGLGFAQSDPKSIFKADAAPYVAWSTIADNAAQCGLRTGRWDDDAHTAISDKFDYFAANLFGSTDNPEAQKAENAAQDAINTAASNAPNMTADQCSHLDDGGALEQIDDLVIQDPNLGATAAQADGMPGA